MRLLAAALITATILGGCGPKTVIPEPMTPEQKAQCEVSNLQVESDNRQLTVSWVSKCTELISGYNIYINPRPFDPEKPFAPHNQTPYPGDTDPDDGRIMYVAEGLQNSVRYYISVRVVYADQSLSKATAEIVATCGPRGRIELAIRYSGQPDGYSFSQERIVEADELSNDVYFFSQDGVDYLDAPTRLDGFLRKSRLVRLPVRGSFREVASYLAMNSATPESDRVEVHSGDWILLRTPESHHVLLQIEGFSGSGQSRRVRLSYAYSGIADEIIF